MNEVQLIRDQLATERAHASAVANACATALESPAANSLEAFRRACIDYLACVLSWFEERDQRLADLMELRFRPGDPVRRAFEEVLTQPGRSRDALAKLEAACAGSVQHAGREFREYFNARWSARRDALEALLASNTRAVDWRSLGGIDADSILEERRRYAWVAAQLPQGMTLGTAAERA